jgi:alpha-amylase/alpha-mannosidase (GH57 family)
MNGKHICIHGHFYQPPRENAWLEEVEFQDSAYPYHDWNDRITAECYAPNTASRIVDSENRILNLINNYSKISFNFGPTLCAWLEKHRPEVLEGIVAADKISKERFSGHGSAIAQVYNHMIMPLASREDKYTQVYWGIIDFEKRFGRFPEGMWLPETAVDIETLEVLAELKIRFTILAPRQARRVKQQVKGARWHEVKESINPRMPYQCELPSGRSIALFFYDGPISQEMAFGGLLNNGETFANRLLSAFDEGNDAGQLVHVATDGESYGHHHKHGDMALSYCLHHIESLDHVQLTNYGEFLEKFPPTHLVEIHENSSWSCVHGIERWRSNCGCNSGRVGWTQEWRAPLREALDLMREKIDPLFEAESSRFLTDPWRARDGYIDVILDRSEEPINRFLAAQAGRELGPAEKIAALTLLEIQRNRMLMYTSCGWFFDEISGIETTQIMQYAARAIQSVEAYFHVPLETRFLEMLEKAPSNTLKNGAEAYVLYVKPASLDLQRVGAHYAIASLFAEHSLSSRIYCYTVESDFYRKFEAGKFTLAVGRAKTTSTLTWNHETLSFAVLHFGDHNIAGGVRDYQGEPDFSAMVTEISAAFDRADMTEVIQLMLKHFGNNNYSVWHLFKDEQRKVLGEILKDTLESVEVSLREIYEENYSVMNFLQSLHTPIPPAFLLASEYAVNAELKRLFEASDIDLDRLETLIQQVEKWSFTVDAKAIQLAASEWINTRVTQLASLPDGTEVLERLDATLRLLQRMELELDVWKAQNTYFSLTNTLYAEEKRKAAEGDNASAQWVALFIALGSHLQVKVE